MKLSKRVFAGITFTTLITVVLTSALIISLMYGIMSKEIKQQIKSEALYISEFLNASEANNAADIGNLGSNRLTIISSDGTVKYDNSDKFEDMANHADRPEFKDALKNGSGESLRTSDTFGRQTYYYAVRLKNGDVLRVACETSSMFGIVTKALPRILFAVIILLALAMAVAGFLTRSIIEPINKLDIDHPLSADTYDELSPLIRRIDKQNSEKDEIEQMRREFSANVSHELKTPLTSIMGCSEIIKEGIAKPEDTPRFLSQINSEAKRLLALIDDIIRLSRLDENDGEIELTDVRLSNIADDVCRELQSKAAASKIELTSSLEPVTVRGNARLLHEMIYNLADNSIRYNTPGGKVRITAGDKFVSVSDTGIGIAPEEQERIFERFYRVDKSHSRETGGTGLGLSIVKHAAIIHNAEIKVTSALGKGTEIRVDFN